MKMKTFEKAYSHLVGDLDIVQSSEQIWAYDKR